LRVGFARFGGRDLGRRCRRAISGFGRALTCALALAGAAMAQGPVPGEPPRLAPIGAPSGAGSSVGSSVDSSAVCPPAPAAAPAAAGSAPARGAAAAAVDRGFLWRISRDGRSSWLYGTVHLAEREWARHGPRVAAALRASEVLALEIDIDDPAMAARLRAAMAAQPGHPLPPALAERLDRQRTLACLPPGIATAMSPELLASTLIVLAGRADGLDPAWGVDPALGRAARALGLPVLSLETPEQQLALLHAADAQDAADNVDKMLASLERGEARPMLRRVAQVWADSRHDELARYTEWCDCTGSERERALLAGLLDGRNPALADGIVAEHARGRRVFAAVGSLHMIGPQGLPALLAARGFEVQRIAF